MLVTSEPAGATRHVGQQPRGILQDALHSGRGPGAAHDRLAAGPGTSKSREIRIIDSPIQVPMVSLRAHTGTLTLDSGAGRRGHS